MTKTIDDYIEILKNEEYRYRDNYQSWFMKSPGEYRDPWPARLAWETLKKYCIYPDKLSYYINYPVLRSDVNPKTALKKIRVAAKHMKYFNDILENSCVPNLNDPEDWDESCTGYMYTDNTVEKWAGKKFKKKYTTTNPNKHEKKHRET
jgi:hypothetical protein